MKAFISDIHGNAEALCVVLEDIRASGIEHVICLGDIVGYGADPELCVDMVMGGTDLRIMGNHDHALIYEPVGFNPLATEVIKLTKEKMNPKDAHGHAMPQDDEDYLICPCAGGVPRCLIMEHSKASRWEYLQNMPLQNEEGGVLYIHGSPLDPTFEYVIPDAIPGSWNPGHIQEMFNKIEWLAFCGHTHRPCIITSDLACIYPEECNYEYKLDRAKKYIVNIGSVGQPRDHDPRSCHVRYDEDSGMIYWKRNGYDIDKTVGKITKMCGAESWCGLRLYQGR